MTSTTGTAGGGGAAFSQPTKTKAKQAATTYVRGRVEELRDWLDRLYFIFAPAMDVLTEAKQRISDRCYFLDDELDSRSFAMRCATCIDHLSKAFFAYDQDWNEFR